MSLSGGATEGLRGGVASLGVLARVRPTVPSLSGPERVMGWTRRKQTARGSGLTGLSRRPEAGLLAPLCLPGFSVGSGL